MKPEPNNADDPTERVRSMLKAAALPATEEEITAIAAAYPIHRAAVDALYHVGGIKYVDPAMRFNAAGRISAWAPPGGASGSTE